MTIPRRLNWLLVGLLLAGCGTTDDSGDDSTDAGGSDMGADGGGDAASDLAGDVAEAPIYWPDLSCEPSDDRCAAFGDERPGRLSEHGATYDWDRQQMVLFGGSSSVPVECGFPASQFVGDTWIYDVPCAGWQRLDVEGPTARGRHMMAYGDGLVWMLGGRYRVDGGSGEYTLFPDLWTFDPLGPNWRRVSVSGPQPEARVNGTLAWDAKRDELWLFGGNASASGAGYSPLADVWVFDPETSAWRQEIFADAPAPRLFHTALYDHVRDRVVVFGGADETAFNQNATYFSDVWALDLDLIRWDRLHDGSGAAPEGRFWSRWVYDTERDSYLLFGGHDDETLGNRNDAWEFLPDEGVWVQLALGDTFNAPANGFCDFPADFTTVDSSLPERRNAHTMVWSPTCRRAVAFGGKTDCGASDDVWEYAEGAFSEAVGATEGEVCHRFRNNPDNCANMCF